MMADGNASFTKALGLDADFSKHGMGTRSQRYSMLVEDGVVEQLNVEQGGFDVSSAETMLSQLG
jgi:peroxiredoxin